MVHDWLRVAFLHWRYDAATVQRLLPSPLRVETHDGDAWVGLVAFLMRVSRPPVPVLPWISVFPETNVRTYVLTPDGRPGVWFFSLDAARLIPVLIALGGYGLPYQWSLMRLAGDGDRWRYRSVRRWPGPRGARCDLAVEVGAPYEQADLTELDHFLTARFTLVNASPLGPAWSPAEHAPWPLHRAKALRLDGDLIEAAGLPAPVGEPLVHWSPGVQVRIGAPHRL